MVSNATQHHTTPSQPHTFCIYVLYFPVGEEGGEQERRLEGQQSWVENTNMTDCISNL